MSYASILSGFNGSFDSSFDSIVPLWSIDLEDEDAICEWFKSAIDTLKDRQTARAEMMIRHRDFYASIQSIALGRTGIPRDQDTEERTRDTFSRVTVNQIYDLTEHWVSQMTRFAPAIAVIPPNSEYNDRIAAKLSKAFIDYLFYVNDIDDLLEECARQCRIFGEAYCFVEWNPKKGDYAPGVQEAGDLGIRVPLQDKDGNQVYSSDDEPLYIDSKPRVGDVDYDLVLPWHVFVQPKDKWKEVEWIIKVKSVDADALKAEYPDKADEIDPKSSDARYSVDYLTAETNFNEVLQFEIYHKSTEFLDKGRYIKLIPGCVLENKELGYSHGELPVVRLTNIDLPGELHGASFYQNIIVLQVVLNNLYSMAYTNVSLGSHLYWLVPIQGNVDVNKLRNSASVIKYQGNVAPKIETFKTVGSEIFQMIEIVEARIQAISGRQPISQGQVPPGVEAGIAMTFLEEQENQRANTDIKKHNAFIKKLARLSLAVAGDKYDASDGRTIRIVGKNNMFSVKALDVAKLGGPYDIRVQRTTALSESKAGRISQLLALEGRFPGMLPREQILDMLDLANDQKFYDMATVALQAAENENEIMLDGQQVKPPTKYEDCIVHWQSHAKFIQSRSFKEDLPDQIKAMFFKHILATEYFIIEKMQQPTVSPLFVQKVQALESFPLFMKVAPVAVGTPADAPMTNSPGAGPAVPSQAPPMDDSMAPEPTDTGEVPPEENASGTDIQAPEDRNPTDSKNPFPAELA
jgi:hypothetical protein